MADNQNEEEAKRLADLKRKRDGNTEQDDSVKKAKKDKERDEE